MSNLLDQPVQNSGFALQNYTKFNEHIGTVSECTFPMYYVSKVPNVSLFDIFVKVHVPPNRLFAEYLHSSYDQPKRPSPFVAVSTTKILLMAFNVHAWTPYKRADQM